MLWREKDIMKILHIQQYYNDGMGYQENLLPYYQSKFGHEVVLITSTLNNGHTGSTREEPAGEYSERNFVVKRVPVKREFKNRFVIFENLYDHIESEKPDYIFHHSVTSPSIITAAKYKKNNPDIFLAADNHADLNISGRNYMWKILYYNFFWKNVLRIVDKFIDVYFGVTPIRCLFMNEELNINKNKIRLLPIGSDVDNINIKILREDFLKKYKINESDFVIVHGGKITPEKNVDIIIKAFSRIKNKNIKLLLFGSILDDSVKRLIQNDCRIIFIGWLNREETLAALKHSDLGIWNTQHTTLLEDTVAVSLPVILRYYGSTSHLIMNSGLYLYEGSIREIQDKLSFIINNKEILKRFKIGANDLLQIISYNEIAKESIDYSKSLSQLNSHKTLMSSEFTDFTYEHLKKLRKD